VRNMKSSVIVVRPATTHTTPSDHLLNVRNLLIVLDDSEAAINAVTYVAETMAGLPETHALHICLAQMLPSYPPELFEIPEREPDQERWKNAAIEAAKSSCLRRAIDKLHLAGVPPESIYIEFFPVEINGEGAPQSISELVQQHRCDAVVIGKAEHSHSYNPFGYDLIRRLSQAMSRMGVNILAVFSDVPETGLDHLRSVAENAISHSARFATRR